MQENIVAVYWEIGDLTGCHSKNEDGANLEVYQKSTELSLLVPSAVAILRDELASSDPDRRLKAAIAVMEMNQKQN